MPKGADAFSIYIRALEGRRRCGRTRCSSSQPRQVGSAADEGTQRNNDGSTYGLLSALKQVAVDKMTEMLLRASGASTQMSRNINADDTLHWFCAHWAGCRLLRGMFYDIVNEGIASNGAYQRYRHAWADTVLYLATAPRYATMSGTEENSGLRESSGKCVNPHLARHWNDLLHVTCRERPVQQMVELITQHNPLIQRPRDEWDNTPLHWGLERRICKAHRTALCTAWRRIGIMRLMVQVTRDLHSFARGKDLTRIRDIML
ncbi:unnamed protein product [Trichogramma brassicae]|uniref:Uncharacterized protein n=1 Tax=Trichogramma brassicae TaxID=86971 RepID=A0A6H5HU29_9HYME|nr:unnamed protein product [Trichogramma brassicae]